MLDKIESSTQRILNDAQIEAGRLGQSQVGTEHILLALTINADCLAARALSLMKLDYTVVNHEVERVTSALKNSTNDQVEFSERRQAVLEFEQSAKDLISEAVNQSRYYGQKKVSSEHLLLALMSQEKSVALAILDDLGANLSFLHRQLLSVMAHEYCVNHKVPSLRSTLLEGISEIVDSHLKSIQALEDLEKNACNSNKHEYPSLEQVVSMACVTYIPEMLIAQVCFQRFLLEDSIRILVVRTGVLDQETIASIVSQRAQNLRLEFRSTVDYLFSHQYRMFDTMLNEAELDLVGSVIEDLWWSQSEEIALHGLFDEALEDHRRAQVLTLQKRKVELTQRLKRLRERLFDTIKQCIHKT